MVFNNAEIHISNLRLRTYIGFNPEELEKKQDVVINVYLRYPASAACDTDQAENALDYKVVTKAIIKHVETGRFKLLEKLTADVLDLVMANERIVYAKVEIEKPHALRFADSVSVALSAERS